MSAYDPRVTPVRDDLAARTLRGVLARPRYADGRPMQVTAPDCALSFRPEAGARQESQLLFGERFVAYEIAGGWAWGQCALDDYVGYVPAAALAPAGAPSSHAVALPRSHLYAAPELKRPVVGALGFGARVRVLEESGGYVRIDEGRWLVARHLRPLDRPERDPVAVGRRLVGVPYLWGGRSGRGFDCSGFVQQVLAACGLAVPRDSDQQQAALTHAVELDEARQGDIVFFPGHCGFVLEGGGILHANAHDMAVAEDRLENVLRRVGEAEGGRVTGVRRPPPARLTSASA